MKKSNGYSMSYRGLEVEFLDSFWKQYLIDIADLRVQGLTV